MQGLLNIRRSYFNSYLIMSNVYAASVMRLANVMAAIIKPVFIGILIMYFLSEDFLNNASYNVCFVEKRILLRYRK